MPNVILVIAQWLVSRANAIVGDNNKVYFIGLVLIVFGLVQILYTGEHEAGAQNLIEGFGVIFARHTFSKVYTSKEDSNG